MNLDVTATQLAVPVARPVQFVGARHFKLLNPQLLVALAGPPSHRRRPEFDSGHRDCDAAVTGIC